MKPLDRARCHRQHLGMNPHGVLYQRFGLDVDSPELLVLAGIAVMLFFFSL